MKCCANFDLLCTSTGLSVDVGIKFLPGTDAHVAMLEVSLSRCKEWIWANGNWGFVPLYSHYPVPEPKCILYWKKISWQSLVEPLGQFIEVMRAFWIYSARNLEQKNMADFIFDSLCFGPSARIIQNDTEPALGHFGTTWLILSLSHGRRKLWRLAELCEPVHVRWAVGGGCNNAGGHSVSSLMSLGRPLD